MDDKAVIPEEGSKTDQRDRLAQPSGVFTPSISYDYNAILGILGNQTQFSLELVQDGQEILAFNGGIGDGQIDTGWSLPTFDGKPLSPETYYCSTRDEEDQLQGVLEKRSGLGVLTGSLEDLVDSWSARGTYQFVKYRDKWREHRDGKALFVGVPKVVTNCSRFGKTGSSEIYGWRRPGSSETSQTAAGYIQSDFRKRNFIDDPYDFRSGRYLFKFLPRDGFQTFVGPNFIDCPFGREHQRWGFMCAEMAKAGGYDGTLPPQPGWMGDLIKKVGSFKVGSVVSSDHGDSGPIEGVMEPERWGFYRDLCEQSVHLLGYNIDQGKWGRLRPRLDFSNKEGPWEGNEKEMAGIVVSVWEILKPMCQRMKQAIQGKRMLEGYCGKTPQDTLIELVGEKNRVKLILSGDLCADVQSKRAKSHPHFNVQRHPKQELAFASYGTWSDGGIYNNLFVPNRGYRWMLDESDSEMWAEPIDGKISSAGYGALIGAAMAHQFVHLHYRELGESFDWALPRAVAEEQLAVIAQALVFESLLELGYAQDQFYMSTEEYNPDSTVDSPQQWVSRRFFYRDLPRAYRGIFAGPFYEDMSIISQNLKKQDPEMTRMAAHLVSICPFFKEPEIACLGGICQENPYDVEPKEPETKIEISGEYEFVSETGSECSQLGSLPSKLLITKEKGLRMTAISPRPYEMPGPKGDSWDLKGAYPLYSGGRTDPLGGRLFQYHFDAPGEFRMIPLGPSPEDSGTAAGGGAPKVQGVQGSSASPLLPGTEEPDFIDCQRRYRGVGL